MNWRVICYIGGYVQDRGDTGRLETYSGEWVGPLSEPGVMS